MTLEDQARAAADRIASSSWMDPSGDYRPWVEAYGEDGARQMVYDAALRDLQAHPDRAAADASFTRADRPEGELGRDLIRGPAGNFYDVQPMIHTKVADSGGFRDAFNGAMELANNGGRVFSLAAGVGALGGAGMIPAGELASSTGAGGAFTGAAETGSLAGGAGSDVLASGGDPFALKNFGNTGFSTVPGAESSAVNFAPSAANASTITQGALNGLTFPSTPSATPAAPAGTSQGQGAFDQVAQQTPSASAGSSTAGNGAGGNMATDDWFDPSNFDYSSDWANNGGAFDNGLAEEVSQLGGDMTPGGDVVGPAAPGVPDLVKQVGDWVKSLPASAQSAATAALKGLFTQDPTNPTGGGKGALDSLLKLGIPAAMVAGLFEKTKSPLLGPMTNAANSAVNSAGAFAALPTPGITPSQTKAITVANDSAGAFKPYLDKAATYTDKAAAGMPSMDLSKYMNPYIENAIDPAATKVRREAAAQKIANDATAGRVGAFGGSRMGVQQAIGDRSELETVGNLYKTGYSDAFDKATGMASTDLNRMGAAGGAFNTLAKTGSDLAGKDFSMLSDAGALERTPYEDQSKHLADTTNLYTGVVHGSAPVITASTPKSTLTQATGAVGALKSLKDLGIV